MGKMWEMIQTMEIKCPAGKILCARFAKIIFKDSDSPYCNPCKNTERSCELIHKFWIDIIPIQDFKQCPWPEHQVKELLIPEKK